MTLNPFLGSQGFCPITHAKAKVPELLESTRQQMLPATVWVCMSYSIFPRAMPVPCVHKRRYRKQATGPNIYSKGYVASDTCPVLGQVCEALPLKIFLLLRDLVPWGPRELVRSHGTNRRLGVSVDRRCMCSGASTTGHTLDETLGEMTHLERKTTSLQSHNGKTLNIISSFVVQA